MRAALVLFASTTLACTAEASAGVFDCIIEPRQILELRSPLDGLIEKVNAERGDFVREGQVLVVLDTSLERAQAEIARYRAQMDGALKSGESRVEFSSRKSGRAQDLRRGNFLSEQSLDEAMTEQRLAEAELNEARDNRRLAELEYQRQLAVINLKTIRSPITGVVTERLQNPGEVAEAGVGRKPILKLADIDTLNVEVLLPLAAFGRIKLGSEVQVTPEILPGVRVRGRVRVIDRVLDAASGTFGVRLELRNADRRIPGGSRCTVDFPGIDDAAAPGRKGRVGSKP
jgi:RND family efflux transporter MFP subunit